MTVNVTQGETWVDVIDISGDLVSFRWTFVFGSDGARQSRLA